MRRITSRESFCHLGSYGESRERGEHLHRCSKNDLDSNEGRKNFAENENRAILADRFANLRFLECKCTVESCENEFWIAKKEKKWILRSDFYLVAKLRSSSGTSDPARVATTSTRKFLSSAQYTNNHLWNEFALDDQCPMKMYKDDPNRIRRARNSPKWTETLENEYLGSLGRR